VKKTRTSAHRRECEQSTDENVNKVQLQPYCYATLVYSTVDSGRTITYYYAVIYRDGYTSWLKNLVSVAFQF